jgi:hypothetical protein
MNKIIEDIENILVELGDNNIYFKVSNLEKYIRHEDQLLHLELGIYFVPDQIFTVRDTIKEYIQEIFIMLNDYCKENELDIRAVYKQDIFLSIDELLDMSKKGLFWKKSLEFYFIVYKKKKIHNFSKFVESKH